MNMEDYISIIIPVYNCETYIDSICKQLANQTFKNFEVLFIDDASTDHSLSLLQEKANEYPFIKVLHNEENKGAGFSRNRGIKEAKYAYIGFLDCDDEIPNDYFECLTSSLFLENADMVVGSVYVTYEASFKKSNEMIEITEENVLNNPYAAAAWNKIIKKEILENNLFAEGIINEDIPSILGSIFDSKKIVYTNKTYYNYIQRKTSVQNGSTILKRFDVFKAMDVLLERKKEDALLKENLDVLVYQQFITFLLYGIVANKNLKRKGKYLKLFAKKSKKYSIYTNPYLVEFINSQNKKNQMFYRTLLKLMKIHFYAFSSLFIKFSYFMNRKSKKSVVKKKITLNLLQKMAMKNQNQKNDITISVIIPNYNYKEYLMERVYSILIQRHRINEIVFLDDASNDDSVTLMNEIITAIGDFIECRTVYNEQNSNSPYKQWHQGFLLVKSDYVWIAEADDYSDKHFLEEVLKPIEHNKNIRISYCDTSFINEEGLVLTRTVKNLIDLMHTGHWNQNYVNNGKKEIENYAFLNCTIANVSSAIIKNENYEEEFQRACAFKQCGDWYFYYSLMKKGDIAYSTKAYNYSRLHGNNLTANLKKKVHFEEIKYMQEGILQKEKVRLDARMYIDKRLEELKKEWHLEN